MIFLPIVSRELRVASRRRGTYWGRAGISGAAVAIGCWILIVGHWSSQRELSLTLFGMMTGCALLAAFLSGLRATADCLSSEKREGTLGLLFLTDLKGYDVVFGKLAATSLNAFYSVLAVVPILALPLLMGGVAPAEFGRMALAVLNALFFSLAAGMGVSASCRSARKAAGGTLGLLLALGAASPLYALSQMAGGTPLKWQLWFLLPSVWTTFVTAFDLTYRSQGTLYWSALAMTHGLGWSFLAWACLAAPRSWQDRPSGATALKWRERWRSWSYGDPRARAAFRRGLLNRGAFYWLAARARLKPTAVWAVLGFGACVWTWGAIRYHDDWFTESAYVMTFVFLNLMLKVWFAAEAGRQLAEDRREGALELLLSTPLTVREILHGQWLALRRQFLGPVLAVLTLSVVFMVATESHAYGENEQGLWILFWVGAMVTLVADLAAIYWVGLWQGMIVSGVNRLAGASLTRIMVAPGVAFALVIALISMVAFQNRRGPSEWTPLVLWFGFGLATDLGFGLHARHKLLTEFRRAAERRYSKPVSFWKRLFGGS